MDHVQETKRQPLASCPRQVIAAAHAPLGRREFRAEGSGFGRLSALRVTLVGRGSLGLRLLHRLREEQLELGLGSGLLGRPRFLFSRDINYSCFYDVLTLGEHFQICCLFPSYRFLGKSCGGT